jgi:hypothetical protein
VSEIYSFYIWIIFHSITLQLLVYSYVDEHFVCFHILAIVAIMNIDIKVLVWRSVFNSFRHKPRVIWSFYDYVIAQLANLTQWLSLLAMCDPISVHLCHYLIHNLLKAGILFLLLILKGSSKSIITKCKISFYHVEEVSLSNEIIWFAYIESPSHSWNKSHLILYAILPGLLTSLVC